MNLIHLQYFQAVAIEENVTIAAQKLHIPQPALSKTIAKLESEMGVSFFDRNGKHISLNANGKLFLRYVNIALSALSDGERELIATQNGVYPDICLNSDACFAALTQLLIEFRHEYPQIRLRLRKENTKMNYPIHKYDLSIIMQPSEQPLPPASIVLFEEDLMLAVSQQHHLSTRDYVNLIDLQNEDFVSFQATSEYRQVTTNYCESVGFVPNTVIECHDWHTVCDFVRGNLGVAIVPKISWTVQYNGLKIIPIKTPHCSRKMILTWFDDVRLTLSSKLFIEFCKRRFNSQSTFLMQ